MLEKTTENVADMMRDIELHFAYRARQEKKKIILSGSDHLSLFCNRDWLSEAIDNIVKMRLTIQKMVLSLALHGGRCHQVFKLW